MTDLYPISSDEDEDDTTSELHIWIHKDSNHPITMWYIDESDEERICKALLVMVRNIQEGKLREGSVH